MINFWHIIISLLTTINLIRGNINICENVDLRVIDGFKGVFYDLEDLQNEVPEYQIKGRNEFSFNMIDIKKSNYNYYINEIKDKRIHQMFEIEGYFNPLKSGEYIFSINDNNLYTSFEISPGIKCNNGKEEIGKKVNGELNKPVYLNSNLIYPIKMVIGNETINNIQYITFIDQNGKIHEDFGR